MESIPSPRKKDVLPGLNELQKFQITSLQKPVTELYRKYETQIERGEYGLVLGDDVSGRIPTLIIAEVIRDTYVRHGHTVPLVRFVSGGYHTPEREISEDADKLEQRMQATGDLSLIFAKELNRREHGTRVLLVTESITLGTALANLVTGIKRAGIDLDVAAVGASTTRGVDAVVEKQGVRVEFGQVTVPSIYGSRLMTGVRKQQGKPVASALGVLYPDTNVSAQIREAREVARAVARKIITDLSTKE